MRTLLILFSLIYSSGALANGCALSSDPNCSANNNGGHTSQQNLSGGYNNYKNGQLQSQSSQNFGGGWTQKNTNGSYNTYNSYNKNSYGSTDNKRKY